MTIERTGMNPTQYQLLTTVYTSLIPSYLRLPLAPLSFSFSFTHSLSLLKYTWQCFADNVIDNWNYPFSHNVALLWFCHLSHMLCSCYALFFDGIRQKYVLANAKCSLKMWKFVKITKVKREFSEWNFSQKFTPWIAPLKWSVTPLLGHLEESMTF